jgi:orotidine-5'-phosphate decarboxylase
MDDPTLASVGIGRSAADHVALLARVAQEGHAAGVVCSPQEAAAMRDVLGEGALVVSPGVRPGWADSDDQARISTPSAALRSGASHLVVGRPITAAQDPAEALERIVAEIEGVGE